MSGHVMEGNASKMQVTAAAPPTREGGTWGGGGGGEVVVPLCYSELLKCGSIRLDLAAR